MYGSRELIPLHKVDIDNFLSSLAVKTVDDIKIHARDGDPRTQLRTVLS